MRITVVRYRLKADRASDNERLVTAVYEELHRTQPSGLRYATFRDDEGVNYAHMAVVEPGLDPHPLLSLPAFKRFAEGIGERCEEPPVSVDLGEVGSYRFFDPGEAS
jgi:hypothetical protein